MVGVDFKIEQIGFDQLNLVLDNLGSADIEEVLTNIGSVIVTQTRVRIQKDKYDPDGVPWQKLSDRYAASKTGSGGILVWHGDLYDSIDSQVSGDELVVGSNLEYAATHQYGDERKAWGKVDAVYPKRSFLGVSYDDEDEIMEIVELWLKGLTRG